jgi:hypothetical protein
VDISCIPKILELYDVVKSEIALAGMDYTLFSYEELAQRIITLLESNTGKCGDIEEKKYALVVSAKEVASLIMVFNECHFSDDIDTPFPDFRPSIMKIQDKLKVLMNAERYG